MNLDDETHARHHEYLDLLLQKEKDRAALRQAIIEKTLAGLIWAAIAAVGHRIALYWLEHFKP